ncbi:MAG: hypothetical protein F6K40_05685, partial [Okeania sp. SIO3I5]|uniref:AAA-like domain-containing protein n=1 Tax=Okeania sp. SIO3I5 TaxID=2607805 RepID=UPI0013B97F2C
MLSPTNYYKVGGSLKYTHPTYVKREGDRLLIDALRNRDFCYVLNSRQMGKSSLRVRAMKQLEKEGLKCASIDVTKIGSYVTQDAWYEGFASELLRGFRLREKVKLNDWWQEHSAANPVQRLGELIEDVLLVEFSQTLVIFVDEIDSMIKLEFKDDFFAFIRACYNQRVDNQDYERLTFCLLGVATVSDLIQDRERTPFNIGKSIELTGFSFDEAKDVLIPGLKNRVENPEKVLAEVLKWTGGQPFLTQKLCQIIVQNNDGCSPDVAELVRTYIINNWESHDNPEHLRTIRDRLLVNEKRSSRLLGLYQQVLIPLPSPLERGRLEEIPLPSPLERGRLEEEIPLPSSLESGKLEEKKPPLSKGGLGGIKANDTPEQMELRLTGLVVKHQGQLQVMNYIYREVFNLQWVEQELAKLRPYSEAFAAWQKSGYQDQSRLLRGEALTDALVWAKDKSLSVLDYRFLTASQELEKQEIEQEKLEMQIKLDAESKVNQILDRAKRKAEKQLQISFGVLALSLMIAAITGVRFWQVNLKEAETEAVGKSITAKLLSDSGNDFEALRQALRAVKQLPHPNAIFRPKAESKIKITNLLWQVVDVISEKLYRQLKPLEAHESSVYSVVFSPDSQMIATASGDNTVKLWNRQGQLLQTLTGHKSWVNGVAFSPDSQMIATASGDNTVKLWNRQGQLLQTLTGHKSWVNGVAFSPDSQMIATASGDNTVKLWNQQGKELQTLKGHEESVNGVAFSPDGQMIATASGDNTVKLWNQQGKELQTLKGHEKSVNGVAFSPDGQMIATASGDNTVKLWNQQGKELQTLKGHEESVNGVALSPDGQMIATASGDNTVKLWNQQGKELQTLKGHEESVNGVA